MAATTVDSVLFSNPNYPARNPAGTTVEYIDFTVATTSLDDIGDRVRLIPMPNAVEIISIQEYHADLDSGGGNLDMDILLVDDNGDTILYNAGTAFNAATTAWLDIANSTVVPGTKVVSVGDDTAYIGLYVNVVASTAASGLVHVRIEYRGTGRR